MIISGVLANCGVINPTVTDGAPIVCSCHLPVVVGDNHQGLVQQPAIRSTGPDGGHHPVHEQQLVQVERGVVAKFTRLEFAKPVRQGVVRIVRRRRNIRQKEALVLSRIPLNLVEDSPSVSSSRSPQETGAVVRFPGMVSASYSCSIPRPCSISRKPV